MRASQTVLPFKLTASDESLTAHAGLVLFDEYLAAMGIAGLINHELPGAGSAAGYVSRITHFEGRVIGLFEGLPAGTSRAL
jgi:hypothetical protein